jgi:hypothetical protein
MPKDRSCLFVLLLVVEIRVVEIALLLQWGRIGCKERSCRLFNACHGYYAGKQFSPTDPLEKQKTRNPAGWRPRGFLLAPGSSRRARPSQSGEVYHGGRAFTFSLAVWTWLVVSRKERATLRAFAQFTMHDRLSPLPLPRN